MSHGSATSTDDLQLAGLNRPVTPEDWALSEAALAEHGGDPVAALGKHHLPEATKAEIRRAFGYQA